MNNYQISLILHTLFDVSDIIFSGLKVLVPLIFLVNFFKINIYRLNIFILNLSVNLMLLTGGIFFSSAFLTDTLMSLHSDNEFGLNFIISIITGPHWFQIVIPIVNYAFIPHIMWFKKTRNTIYSSFLIVLIWMLSGNLTEYLTKLEGVNFSTPKTNAITLITGYAWKSLINIIFIAFIYLFLSRRHNKSVNQKN